MSKVKKRFLFALMVGIVALSGRVATAQNFVSETGTNTTGSRAFGFDPSVSLIPAVTNTDPNAGPCFTCPNTGAAGGTTAGALTNSMFGEIRLNSEADLGNQSFMPPQQGMTIPMASGCTPAAGFTGCNDSGAFTFSIPLPTQDFLSSGVPVPTTNPAVGQTVGDAGVKMEFDSEFTFRGDGTSVFSQTVTQTTFTGGFEGNELQVATIESHSDSPNVSFLPAGDPRKKIEIFWSQKIVEGGFLLGPTSGSFISNRPPNGPNASAPTGVGQSNGDPTSIDVPENP